MLAYLDLKLFISFLNFLYDIIIKHLDPDITGEWWKESPMRRVESNDW